MKDLEGFLIQHEFRGLGLVLHLVEVEGPFGASTEFPSTDYRCVVYWFRSACISETVIVDSYFVVLQDGLK